MNTEQEILALRATVARLTEENAVLRGAQKVCADCETVTYDQLRAENARLVGALQLELDENKKLGRDSVLYDFRAFVVSQCSRLTTLLASHPAQPTGQAGKGEGERCICGKTASECAITQCNPPAVGVALSPTSPAPQEAEPADGFTLDQEPEALVDSALQVYARAGQYLNKGLHDAAHAYRTELIRLVTLAKHAPAAPVGSESEKQRGWGQEFTDTELLDYHIMHMKRGRVCFTRNDIAEGLRAARKEGTTL